MIISKKILLVVIIIFGLGLFLRLYKLTELPAGATLDEVSIGYNAFTISQTGRDQDGNWHPLTHFRSLNDYKLPIYIYTVSLFQKIFDNSLLTIRLPAAIFGALIVPLTFLLARSHFGNIIGILAALLLAISPWHVFHSHLGLETNLGLFFSIVGMYLLSISRKNNKILIIAVAFFLLTIYAYHAYWIFLPPFLLVYLLLYKSNFSQVSKREIIILLIVVIIMLVPFLRETNSGGKSRLNQSVFSYGAITKLQEESKIYCKQAVCSQLYVGKKLTENILNNALRSYSFIAWYLPSGFGTVDVMPNRGLFYFFEFPLLVMGIIYLCNKKSKDSILFITWLILFSLPLAVTTNFSATRMYLLLPAPQIIEALGMVMLIKRYKVIGLILPLIIVFSFLRFLSDYYFIYAKLYSRYTGYGPLKIVQYIKENNTKQIYVEEPLMHRLYVLYFFEVLPAGVGKPFKDKRGTEYIGYRNIHIVDRGYLPPQNKDTVLISFPEDVPDYLKKTDEIKLKDNSMYAVISTSK